MRKNAAKKLIYVSRACMTVLTTVLIVLFFCIMSLVGKIQGTARVVNYAGLVRGTTQRIVKLENMQSPQDEMLEEVESIIIGLRYGSDDLNLVRLDDSAFQDKMQELEDYFETLKVEIQLVRENGYENTQIIEKSEQFFRICDEATGLAEAYSQRKATALNQLEQVVFADIAGLLILIAMEIFKALRYAAQNRILQKKVYLDEATGLPNKNKCEEILDNDTFLENGETVAVCVFDLNNLRIINNNLGHEKGDEYIRSFAVQLRGAMPSEHFVGRDGGDEFLAVIRGLEREAVEASAMRLVMRFHRILNPAACGICSGRPIRICMSIRTAPRCWKRRKSRMKISGCWIQSNSRAIRFRTACTAMHCSTSTGCCVRIPSFFWRRKAATPVQWSRLCRNWPGEWNADHCARSCSRRR